MDVAKAGAEAAEAREAAAKAGMAEQEDRARSADSRADTAEARVLELDERNAAMVGWCSSKPVLKGPEISACN